MRRVHFAFTLLVACTAASAQEIVTLASRPGATESFFIANMGGRQPEAVAMMYIGGHGNIRLREEDGQIKFGANNFLPRSRVEFIRNGVLPVIIDTPSDQRGGVSNAYRFSEEQTQDARAIVAELRKRYPALPIFVVGTSKSTLTAASLGRALGADLAGVVLTSSMSVANPRESHSALDGFDFGTVKAPLLFVHHRDDGCKFTPYNAAARVAKGYPMISVKGGKPPESGPCDPFAAHGYFGKEAETVDAIAGWMLKKPFAKDIE
jgi:hypothetical protein